MSKDFYVVVSAHPSDFEGTLQAHGWFTDNEQADDYAELNGGRAIRCAATYDWIEVWRHSVYGILIGGGADSRTDLEDQIHHRIKSSGGDPLSDCGNIVQVKYWGVSDGKDAEPIEQGEHERDDTPEHDASFTKGWNSVASIAYREVTDFDPDHYLQGVTEAIAEYRLKEEEQAQLMNANRPDLEVICKAVERIKAAGIDIVAKGDTIEFMKRQGIRFVRGPEFQDDCPF